MRLIALFLAVWLSVPVEACVWIRGTSKEGKKIRTSGFGTAFHLKRELQKSIETDLKVEGKAMEERWRNANWFDARNDYAVALIYLGRNEEAVKLLEQLEREKPGEYTTAANLGTAHELAGRNIEAKKWIEEGIRRNPGSHYGTEWLHVKILEAKIRHDRDPSNPVPSVLNLDYKSMTTGAEELSVDGQEMRIKDLHFALEHQLSERLKFVKGKDAIVAWLLFDFAMLEAGIGTLENARDLLLMAADYGYPQEKVDALLKQWQSTMWLGKLRSNLLIFGGVLAGVLVLWFLWKRKIFVLRRV